MKKNIALGRLEAIAFWAKGGNLWYYDDCNEVWKMHSNVEMGFESIDSTSCVIQDKHFEARKAYALGIPIEVKGNCEMRWKDCEYPTFGHTFDYRVKPVPIKVWQWICRDSRNNYKMTTSFYACRQDAQNARTSDRWTIVEAYKPSERTKEC